MTSRERKPRPITAYVQLIRQDAKTQREVERALARARPRPTPEEAGGRRRAAA